MTPRSPNDTPGADRSARGHCWPTALRPRPELARRAPRHRRALSQVRAQGVPGAFELLPGRDGALRLRHPRPDRHLPRLHLRAVECGDHGQWRDAARGLRQRASDRVDPRRQPLPQYAPLGRPPDGCRGAAAPAAGLLHRHLSQTARDQLGDGRRAPRFDAGGRVRRLRAALRRLRRDRDRDRLLRSRVRSPGPAPSPPSSSSAAPSRRWAAWPASTRSTSSSCPRCWPSSSARTC